MTRSSSPLPTPEPGRAPLIPTAERPLPPLSGFIPWKRLAFFAAVLLYGVGVTVFMSFHMSDLKLGTTMRWTFLTLYAVLAVAVFTRVVQAARRARDHAQVDR